MAEWALYLAVGSILITIGSYLFQVLQNTAEVEKHEVRITALEQRLAMMLPPEDVARKDVLAEKFDALNERLGRMERRQEQMDRRLEQLFELLIARRSSAAGATG